MKTLKGIGVKAAATIARNAFSRYSSRTRSNSDGVTPGTKSKKTPATSDQSPTPISQPAAAPATDASALTPA